MKKQLLGIPLILAGMAAPAYIVAQHPKIVTVTKEVPVIKTETVTKTVQAPVPSYHVGDTQVGITLIGTYHSSYQDMMGGGNSATPPIVKVVAFALSGISQEDADQYTAIVTSKGLSSSHPALTTIAQCGTNACAVFYGESTPTIFYYKDLKWEL